MQSLKLAASAPGADGVARIWPLLLASCISSAAVSFAVAPLVVAPAKCTVPRFGSAEMPVPLVPISSGVSSIHSALPPVDV